ncbi:MAG: BACON domain-containing carbohydrate-binding protein [Dehalococcoidia bacterium]
MKHWKGILAIIVSLGLALALLPLSITGASGTVIVGIDAPAKVNPGSFFVAKVTVDSVTDLDTCGFDVTYNQTIITVTDVTGGEIDGHTVEVPPGYWSYIPYGEENTGRIRVIAAVPGTPAPGVTGTGYLAQVHFEVIGSGGSTSDITPERVGMYDWQANPIRTTTESYSVQVSQPTEPTIAFNPKRFTFPATAGGANPASQILEIWNSGPGTIDWSVSDDAAWLTLAPTTGSSTGEHDEVTALVDIADISAGNYSATITIAAAGATNTPQTLTVSLTFTETEGPMIAFSPASLSFSAVAGKANPANQTLEIWNSGTGTLDWSVNDDAAWLTLAPTSGSSGGEHDMVTASVDIADMSAGDYSATITIAAAGATNTPRTLAVSLILTETEAPTIAFGPASLSFSAVAGEANPANQTLEIWNSGTGTLDWLVSDDTAWLTLASTNGSSTGEHDKVTASVYIAGMSAGDYSATITVAAAGATNTPRTLAVSLTLTETEAPISPIDTLRVMAPWIAVGAAIIVGISLLVRRHRRRAMR